MACIRCATAAASVVEHGAVEHERHRVEPPRPVRRGPRRLVRRAQVVDEVTGERRRDRRGRPRSGARLERPCGRGRNRVEQLLGRASPDPQVALGDPPVERAMATCRASIASSSAAPSVLAAVESRSTASTWSTASSGAPGIGQLGERPADLPQQRPHGPREAVVLEQEAHDRRTLDRAADGPLVHLQALHRAQHAHPLHLVVALADRRRRRCGPSAPTARRRPGRRAPGSSCRPARAPARAATSRTPRRGSSPSPARRRGGGCRR